MCRIFFFFFATKALLVLYLKIFRYDYCQGGTTLWKHIDLAELRSDSYYLPAEGMDAS